jgi:hypothetical protein
MRDHPPDPEMQNPRRVDQHPQARVEQRRFIEALDNFDNIKNSQPVNNSDVPTTAIAAAFALPMTDTTIEPAVHPSSAETALTNAERQRRYRQRNTKRNACDRNDRNDRNALTVTPAITSRVTSGGVMVLCASQDKIEITFDDDGDAIITQTRWPDEDQMIIVSRDNIPVFIDKLTDALGIPSLGRP